jgi:hypothetical protein
MIDFVKDFWMFLKERRRYWLVPVMLILIFFGVLIIASTGSALAPFIYTLF